MQRVDAYDDGRGGDIIWSLSHETETRHDEPVMREGGYAKKPTTYEAARTGSRLRYRCVIWRIKAGRRI